MVCLDIFLGGGWTTQLKNMHVKLHHFPRDRGFKNIWNHQVDFSGSGNIMAI